MPRDKHNFKAEIAQINFFTFPYCYGIWLFGGESADPKRVKELIAGEIVRLQTEGLDAALVEEMKAMGISDAYMDENGLR